MEVEEEEEEEEDGASGSKSSPATVYISHVRPSGRCEARGAGRQGGRGGRLSGEGRMSNSRRAEKPNVAAGWAWILCSGLVSNKLRSCSAASCAVRLGEVPHGVRQRRLCRFLKCAGCCCCLGSLSLPLSLSLSLSVSSTLLLLLQW